MKKDLSDFIMYRIALPQINLHDGVSVAGWIVTGLIIFISIFLVSYSDWLIWMKYHFGKNIEIAVSIVLGLFISAYSAIFIGTNIDRLKGLFRDLSRRVH